jgi:hypothetical protein
MGINHSFIRLADYYPGQVFLWLFTVNVNIIPGLRVVSYCIHSRTEVTHGQAQHQRQLEGTFR